VCASGESPANWEPQSDRKLREGSGSVTSDRRRTSCVGPFGPVVRIPNGLRGLTTPAGKVPVLRTWNHSRRLPDSSLDGQAGRARTRPGGRSSCEPPVIMGRLSRRLDADCLTPWRSDHSDESPPIGVFAPVREILMGVRPTADQPAPTSNPGRPLDANLSRNRAGRTPARDPPTLPTHTLATETRGGDGVEIFTGTREADGLCQPRLGWRHWCPAPSGASKSVPGSVSWRIGGVKLRTFIRHPRRNCPAPCLLGSVHPHRRRGIRDEWDRLPTTSADAVPPVIPES